MHEMTDLYTAGVGNLDGETLAAAVDRMSEIDRLARRNNQWIAAFCR